MLEIACCNYQSCLNAVENGADRIELFENLHEGGCTPSYGMLLQCIKNISIPIYVMIRPRGGNFFYSKDEIEIMKSDIKMVKKLGFAGVVFGVLDAKGNINKKVCSSLLKKCGEMPTTFHRAFDRTPNLEKSIQTIIDLGFERVLTSGGKPTVSEGINEIATLQSKYGDKIIIMPGSGINAQNLKEIITISKCKEFHATAKEKVNESQINKFFNDTHFVSDSSEIKELANILKINL
jgi:copper homeostasis protein